MTPEREAEILAMTGVGDCDVFWWMNQCRDAIAALTASRAETQAAREELEAKHAKAVQLADTMRAERTRANDAEAALVALRETALNLLAWDLSIEAGTFAERGSGHGGQKAYKENVAALTALHDAAHATPSTLAATVRVRLRKEVLNEAAALLDARASVTDESVNAWVEGRGRALLGHAAAHLRSLATEGEGEAHAFRGSGADCDVCGGTRTEHLAMTAKG